MRPFQKPARSHDNPRLYGVDASEYRQDLGRSLQKLISTRLLPASAGGVPKALTKPARLIPVPTSLLKAGAALLGRSDMAQRLCGSLQVDISKARILLGWNPPVSVDEGLRRAAQGFLHETSV